MKMNKAYLLTLVCSSIKTVEVTFDFNSPAAPGRGYTYLTILALKEGEDVIVETPDGLKVAQVVNVHEEAEVDPHTQFEYKWAVSKTGTTARAEQARLHKLQAEALKQIAQAEKKAQRQKLKAQLEDHFGAELKAISATPFEEGMLE